MKLTVAIITLLVTTWPAYAIDALEDTGPQPLSTPSREWTDLTTPEAWRGYQKDSLPDGWQMEEGCLARLEKAGTVISRVEYENFELQFEWKVAKGGNSGINYYVQESEVHPNRTGPEYQMTDNAGKQWGDKPTGKLAAGGIYSLYGPAKDASRPAGEWNTGKIFARGTQIEHWLNGQKVVEATIGSDDWNARVAKEKFVDYPKFGKRLKGHLTLQDHSTKVWFRNLRIRQILPQIIERKRVPGECAEYLQQLTVQALFDGTSLDAWRGFKQETPPTNWKIVDGVLQNQGKGTDLITRDQFGDFDLMFEWRVEKGANSGLLYNVSEVGEAAYESGYEYQVLDNAAFGFEPTHPQASASFYAIYPPNEKIEQPLGEWNTARIKVEKGQIEHWLNGKQVVIFNRNSPDYARRLATSKFAGFKHFGKTKQGHIALQAYPGKVQYRNIGIRRLSDSPSDTEPQRELESSSL